MLGRRLDPAWWVKDPGLPQLRPKWKLQLRSDSWLGTPYASRAAKKEEILYRSSLVV